MNFFVIEAEGFKFGVLGLLVAVFQQLNCCTTCRVPFIIIEKLGCIIIFCGEGRDGGDGLFISLQQEPYIPMADDIRVHDEPHRIRQIQE